MKVRKKAISIRWMCQGEQQEADKKTAGKFIIQKIYYSLDD